MTSIRHRGRARGRSAAWSLALSVVASGCGGAASGPAPTTPGTAPMPTVLVAGPSRAAAAATAAQGRPGFRVAVARPEAAEAPDRGHEVARVREAYLAMDFEGALELAGLVIAHLETSSETRADLDLLTLAWIRRAEAELALTRPEAAEASLEAAARLKPNLELEGTEYPPAVVTAWDEARRRLTQAPERTLTVTSTPSHARLRVDGIMRGTTPMTLRVPAGRPLVQVHAPGYAPQSQRAFFGADNPPLDFQLRLADAPTAARQSIALERDPGLPARQALSRTFQARRLITVTDGSRGPADPSVQAFELDLDRGTHRVVQAASLEAALAELGTPASDVPATQDRIPTTGTEGDWLLRGALGVNLRGDRYEQEDPASEGEANTVAADAELALGYAVFRRGFLGLSIQGLFGSSELAVTDGAWGTPSLGSVQSLAIFFAWYPDPARGWNLFAALGAGRGSLSSERGAVIERDRLVGGVLTLGGGYDWLLSNRWSVGVALRLIGYGLRQDGTNVNTGGLSLLGTVSYW